MKASIVSMLSVAAAVSAGYSAKPVTTVYATNVYTTAGQVTTDIVSLYTTECPEEETSTGYPAGTPTGAPYPTYPVSSAGYPVGTGYPASSQPGGPAIYPTYPAGGSGGSGASYPASPPSSPSYPAGGSGGSGASYPASSPVLTTVTVSTCIPTVITSVYTVTPSAPVYPTYPAGTGVTPPKQPTGTGSGSPTGGSYPYTSSTPSTVPYTGAAGANKVGGLLMVVGFVAALL